MALALYRKYRPATFAEVVGQDHVTQPLRTALGAGRINHAYLFSGPRGCGKTSSARIMARSLNCVQGPTPDPCGVCPSCIALAPEGPGSLDVVELDAASHGGVDDTRDLRDRAFYMPAESRYRVFIIDEAHMVSAQGFNALLKIVEEPPEHLVFIFATTEPDKVMTTIRSRTHHYPFRLIPPATLRTLLERLCAEEAVQVEPAVYPLVIRAGGGSARDSLSILDQLLAGAGADGVTYRSAVSLLGVTDAALLDETVDALAADDGASVFGAIDKVVEAGHDPRRFAADLLQRLRDLVILAAVPDAGAKGLIDAPDDQVAAMQGQSERLGPGTLTRLADLLHTGLTEMRGTTAPRLALELMCARMLLPAAAGGEGALVQRVERLEQAVSGGSALPPAGPAQPGAAPSVADGPAGDEAGRGSSAAYRRPSLRTPPAAPRTPVAPAPAAPVPAASAPAASGPTAPEAGAPGPTAPEPAAAGPAAAGPAVARPAASAVPGSRGASATPPPRTVVNPALGLPSPPKLSSRRPGAAAAGPAVPSGRSSTAQPDAAGQPTVLAPTDDWAPPDAPPDEDEYGDPGPGARQSGPPARPTGSPPRSTPTPNSEQPHPRTGPVPAGRPAPSADAPATGPSDGVRPAAAVTAAADAAGSAGPAASPVGPSGQQPLDVTDARRAWPEILAAVQRRKRVTQAMLTSATVTGLVDGVLHLTVGNSAMSRRVMEAGNVTVLREAIDEVLSVQWAIRCDAAGESPPARRPALSVVPDPPTDTDDAPDDYDVRVADPEPTNHVVGDPEVTAIELLTQQLGARRLDG